MGKYIVLGLENESNLVTLELKNSKVNQNLTTQITGNAIPHEDAVYGDVESDGKVFQL